MATIESVMVAALKADGDLADQIAGRVYPSAAPADASLPLLIYEMSGEEDVEDLKGNVVLRLARFSLDGYAEDYATAKGVAAQVWSVLKSLRRTTSSGVSVRGVRKEDRSDTHNPPVHADERGLFSVGLNVLFSYNGGA